MGKEGYAKFVKRYRDLLDTQWENYLVYGPLTNQYWSEKYRILFCNLEPHHLGKQFGKPEVDYKYIEENWLGNSTIENSKLFVDALFKALESGRALSSIQIEKLCADTKYNLSPLRRISYMNWRVTTSNETNQSTNAILNQTRKLKDLIREQIEFLDPKVVIVGGKLSPLIVNELYSSNLEFGKHKFINGKLFFSIPHPSRKGFVSYAERIGRIKKLLIEKVVEH